MYSHTSFCKLSSSPLFSNVLITKCFVVSRYPWGHNSPINTDHSGRWKSDIYLSGDRSTNTDDPLENRAPTVQLDPAGTWQYFQDVGNEVEIYGNWPMWLTMYLNEDHMTLTLWITFVVVFLICRPLWTNNTCNICWKDSCSSLTTIHKNLDFKSCLLCQSVKLAYIHPCPQRGIWGSSLELILYMRNVSSGDNLHNLTCEAENRAGMGEAVVQLDIECKWWHFLFFNFRHFFTL